MAMAAVFNIEIRELGEGYSVSAWIGDKKANGELGALKDDFWEQLAPLEDEILAATGALPDEPASTLQAKAEMEERELGRQPSRFARGFQTLSRGADVRRINEVGEQLFKAVFHQSVYGLFDEQYKRALANKKEMPIRLCIDAPTLSQIPWETMFDRESENHLSSLKFTPFARAVSTDDDEQKIRIDMPLRILLVAASPRGLPPIDAAKEQDAIRSALKELEDQMLIRIGQTDTATLHALDQAIEKGDEGKPWHVLHFIGHGETQGVAFEAEGTKEVDWIRAEYLKEVISGPRGPQLVVLNSCKGAGRARGDRFSSTAETLVKGNQISAVVAMQFEVSNKMAIRFSPYFYTQLLLKKNSLRYAMTLTRQKLKREGVAEWITPVLYMRGGDAKFIIDPGK